MAALPDDDAVGVPRCPRRHVHQLGRRHHGGHHGPSRLASGLIVNLSYWSARKRLGNALYGMAKAATDKMAADMAHELDGRGVTVVSLYPGLVRTEAVLAAGGFDLSNSESPEFIGRAMVALVRDPRVTERSGEVLVAARLGREYGFTDIDGRTPRPLTLDEA